MTYANAVKIRGNGNYSEYDVTVRRQQYGKTKRTIYHVTMDKELLQMRCDCKNFEFKGIICSHLLCAIHEEELEFVPEKYILDRWRNDLPREHLKIPVPYYSLLKIKPKEMKMFEKMQSLFEPVSTFAMTNDRLYDEVMSALSDLSLKARSIIGDDQGLMTRCLDNVGKVYGRRIITGNVSVVSELETNGDNLPRVSDPTDKRVQSPVCNIAMPHNVLVNPPFTFTSDHTKKFQ
ncbi:hypothetical protein QQ045_024292 [Rhodiola kirilowii]